MGKLGIGLAAAFGLVAVAQPARAETHSGMRHVSCTVVRFYVARYSEATAEAWARSNGATDDEIARARKCLPRPTVQASYAGR